MFPNGLQEDKKIIAEKVKIRNISLLVYAYLIGIWHRLLKASVIMRIMAVPVMIPLAAKVLPMCPGTQKKWSSL